ncbi:uncharacterized protein [Battus philenor]|uniref:uncharacterized protein n=1 Tax=Battus philenor TaxID=42288 RepID=UPI0035CFB431
MWKTLQDSPPFFLQLTQTKTYEISITDYITLYSLDLSEKEFISILKESNPKLLKSDKDFIDEAKNMLENLEELKELSLCKEDCYIKVNIMSKMFDYPFNLKLVLPEAAKEIFFKKITQPLLRKVSELKNIEQNLRQLVKSKDDEILTYKMNGGRIQKYERTPVFNEEEHLKNHKVFQNAELPEELPALLENKQDKGNKSEMNQEVTETKEVIKQEPSFIEEHHSLFGDQESENKLNLKREHQNSETVLKKRKKKLNL